MSVETVRSGRNRWWVFGSVLPLVLGLDQATKLYVHTAFALHESYPIVEHFFAFTYVRNSGAAFGFLARQSPAFLQIFFPVMILVTAIALCVYFVRLPAHATWAQWGVCLILGGALGNGLDRLWLGQVIDFIDVHWYSYHWPAFNIADSSICIGVGFVLWDAVRQPHAES